MKKQNMRARRALCLLLALLCLHVPALGVLLDYTPYAEQLSALGVFRGTGSGFELERTAKRSEGVTMLVRLMGGEAEAGGLAGEEIPFTDVPEWARGYVAYAWTQGITKGIGETTFGADQAIDARMFATFLLRCLGYRDGEGDFTYAKAIAFSNQIGLISDAFWEELQSSAFHRGHMARMCYEALRFPCKDTDLLLVERLAGQGKVSEAAASALISSVIVQRPPQVNLEVTEIAQNARSIVLLLCETPGGYAQGSGIIIGSDGTIVTNYHVIDGAAKISVAFDDETHYEGEVWVQDYDKGRDLAILKIDRTGLPSVKLGDSDQVRLGESVVAIGSPVGLFNTVSEGIISSIWDGELQTTAAISQGSSGGALFNRQGEVIGVTYAAILGGENLGFAIPVNLVKDMTKKQMLTLTDFAAGTAPAPPPNLRVVRETAGIAFLQWDPTDADHYHVYYRQAGEERFGYGVDKYGNQLRFSYGEGYSAELTGLTPGGTYQVVVTSVRDGVESEDSQVLTFIKQTAGGQDTTAYYSDAWWLPDFGALYGYTPTVHENEYGLIIYEYNIDSFAPCEDYYDLLTGLGYAYDAAATANLTSFQVPMCFYNAGNGHIVVSDVPGPGVFALYTM